MGGDGERWPRDEVTVPPPTLSSPSLSSPPIGWESQRASFPPDTPRDKGCLS